MIWHVLSLLALNIATYAAFGWDKHQALRGGRRVPERHLLGLAALGGIVGAKLAQHRLRHKTRKQPFATWLTLIAIAQGTALAAFWWFTPA